MPTKTSSIRVAPVALHRGFERRINRVAVVKSLRRRVALTMGVFGVIVGVGAGLPAYGQSLEQPVTVPQTQSLAVVNTPDTALTIARDTYTVYVPPALQYPLAPGTSLSSGFGPRQCNGCSTYHEGVDLTPGAGTPISAIAAGVVVVASSAGPLGVHAEIEHVINGESVRSVYAHMETGSLTLRVGDPVLVGQVIGTVGDTGNSYGAHLHFELHPQGASAVDPYGWLAARIG
ncbi:MAG: hypothetical protein JWP30_272 [Homoserinimonas sp.]|jgi:murein DD-endopeptidase MepM/ murein hydrolase activator NlpD|nr:hypothetical protein [Homoserinimonas sp.]